MINHRQINNNNDMNKNNLQTMYNWLTENKEKINPSFNIKHYREYLDYKKHECNSTGCLIGWGVGAFPDKEILRNKDNSIKFHDFIRVVLEMNTLSDKWLFIFDSDWHSTEYSSFDDAMSRFKHVIEGKPIEDHEQYKTFLDEILF